MENDAYNFIEDLDIIKDSWKLKVKILSLWKTTYQLEVVVMDERGNKIQASVKHVLIPVFEGVLEEGIVVMLSKFGVGANSAKYPMVKHKFKLNFYRGTHVKRCVRFDGPRYGFDFMPFGQMLDHKDDPELPVDVIGCVVQCGDLDIYDKGSGKEGKRMTLHLEDLHGLTAKCTLWDNFAQQFHDYVSLATRENHVVIILQFGRIRNWKGDLTFQNALFSTKLWIDDDIPEIIDFRQRFICRVGTASSSQGGSALSSQHVYSVREEFLSKTKRSTIDEIVDSTEAMVCVVVATIKSYESEHGWFYVACMKCKKKVLKNSEVIVVEDIDGEAQESVDDGKLYCPKCKEITAFVYPSFKVQARVQDSTGTTSFVLFDRDMVKLLHKQAMDIQDKQERNGIADKFPEDFNQLVDRMFLFKVEVSKYNIDLGYQVYTVLKVCQDPSIITDFVNTNPDDQDDDQEIDGKFANPHSSNDGSPLNKDSVPYTGDSSVAVDGDSQTETSPPLKRARHSLEPDAVEGNSSTKKTKLVSVKIAKD